MFQPEVKLEFVRRYCCPQDGWKVFVDIDASEEGCTGGERKENEAIRRQEEMQKDGYRVRRELKSLGVQVGGNRMDWFHAQGLPVITGDRDIVAFHEAKRICLIAEAEGQSSGQPEQKLYKAIGQIVVARSTTDLPDWERRFVLVVHGDQIARHLEGVSALANLNVSAVALADNMRDDRWLFGAPPLHMGPQI